MIIIASVSEEFSCYQDFDYKKIVRSAIGNFHAMAPKITLILEIFMLRCQLYIQMCKKLSNEF